MDPDTYYTQLLTQSGHEAFQAAGTVRPGV